MPRGFKKDGTKLGFQPGHKFCGPGGKSKDIDVELLKERYLIDKISTHALQKEFDLTNNAIRNRLKKAGIRLRSWREAQLLIPHESPIKKLGYERWYSVTQSPKARKKRAVSHTGKKFSDERKRHMRGGIGTGKNNHSYLGDKAKYKAKHTWVCRHWSKTGTCSYCKKKPKKTVWANLDWKYDREKKNTWLELCNTCNRVYDTYPSFRIIMLKELGIKLQHVPSKNTPRPTY